MKWRSQIIAMVLIGCVLITPVDSFAKKNALYETTTASEGRREYGNILIVWKSSGSAVALDVTITMGTALIGSMHFTPDTLKQSLKYSNPPQSATGVFVVEFNATGTGGKLYVENLKWASTGSEGNVTSLVGIWSTSK